jgi:Ran GTPase-activating protein (RanGAP) involved in mRNA processing and transport
LLRLEVVGSTRILPESVILRLDLLETLHCSSTMQPLENVGMGMVFPPEKFCSDLLSVRNFFSAKDIEIDFKKSGLRVQDVANLGAALENVVVQSIDLSDNEALGTLGVAMVLEWVGPGVKSVNMKGTGLGLAAGQSLQQGPSRTPCSAEDWPKLEDALRKLAKLEAIDLSDNGALGTLGVAMVLELVGPGVKSVNMKGTGLEPVPILSNSSGSFLSFAWMIGIGSSANPKPEASAHGHSKKLESALRKLAKLEAIDLSDNGALGTLGVAMVLEWVGPAVKSVNMKGTGLGLAAGQSLQQGPSRTPCSAEDWPKLEDALRKLAKLEAIDLSDNGALGTLGVAMVLELVGPAVKSVNMKGTGLGLAAGQSLQQGPSRTPCSAEDWSKLEDALRKLAKLEAIGLSDNGALGTLGVAMVLELVGPGVKSVNMKGTGLGLAAGQSLQQGPSRTPCSAEDWPKLEDALRKLAKLEAIDLSDNGALGTSGVGRLVSCCAGESLSFMARLVRLLLFL